MNKILDFFKKQRASTYITLATFILALVAMSIYCANGNTVGYFKGSNSGGVVALSVLSVIMLGIALVLTQIEVENDYVTLGIRVLADVLKVVAAVFMVIVLMDFIQTRVNGLAYIYFSNESVKQEVQTPENLASAQTAIAGFVVYGIAWVLALVNAFFSVKSLKTGESKAEETV